MKFGVLIITAFVLRALPTEATEVTIDATNLQFSTPIFISEGDIINRIPESGMLTLRVENLPTIIGLVSLNKSRVETHRTIWLTGSALEINGSTNGEIKVSPASSGEVLPHNIEEKWKQIATEKVADFAPSKPFLVYLVNKIKFQETNYLQQIVDQIPEKDDEFWAAKSLMTYLRELDNIGFDPSKNRNFVHLG